MFGADRIFLSSLNLQLIESMEPTDEGQFILIFSSFTQAFSIISKKPLSKVMRIYNFFFSMSFIVSA
jgi:hypothetical protein